MSIIFFDLEWNMGYPRPDLPHFDEIIEIGAAKVDDGRVTDTYKQFIRPVVHRKLHHHVRKMLPFSEDELSKASGFRSVIKEFKEWCGENAKLVSWGNSDISVLQSNLEYYHLKPDWVGEVYDLQAAYAYLLEEYTHQYSLKDVVEQLQIEDPEEFHDAANDAYYTALISIAMDKKWNGLPSAAVIQAKRDELREIHAAEQRVKALTAESSALQEAEVLSFSKIPAQKTLERLLDSDACAVWNCPVCGRRIRALGWSWYAESCWAARGHCDEHGWYFACVTISEKENQVTGERKVLSAGQKMKNTWYRFGHAKAEHKHKS